MNKIGLNKIIKQIGNKFPGFKGIKPQITEKTIKPQTSVYRKLSMGAPKQVRKLTYLRFKKKAITRDRVALKQILVVTLDENGRVLKTSMSK